MLLGQFLPASPATPANCLANWRSWNCRSYPATTFFLIGLLHGPPGACIPSFFWVPRRRCAAAPWLDGARSRHLKIAGHYSPPLGFEKGRAEMDNIDGVSFSKDLIILSHTVPPVPAANRAK